MAEISGAFMEFLGRVQQNVLDTFAQLTPEKYVRLVVVVCAYALLRPHLLRLAGKKQTKEHEKGVEVSPSEEPRRPLSDQVQVPEDSDDDGAQEAGADWGKRARRRQRRLVRSILEADERLQREDNEDKDIQEFLVE